jgi:hypothetical protein
MLRCGCFALRASCSGSTPTFGLPYCAHTWGRHSAQGKPRRHAAHHIDPIGCARAPAAHSTPPRLESPRQEARVGIGGPTERTNVHCLHLHAYPRAQRVRDRSNASDVLQPFVALAQATCAKGVTRMPWIFARKEFKARTSPSAREKERVASYRAYRVVERTGSCAGVWQSASGCSAVHADVVASRKSTRDNGERPCCRA